VTRNQTDISSDNAAFWDELCGSQLAKSLGVTDWSPASLKKFDDWYFQFYPYLFDHIPFDSLKGKDVLEVGLGYGTVSQRLAEAGANYSGLDIAQGPVSVVNQRMRQAALNGQATQGSILEPPFGPESFDAVVAIGCLHHTGDLQRAISQCWNVLRPGGQLIVMVYYAYSYRRFLNAPASTLRYAGRELLGYRGGVEGNARERAAYDAGGDGNAAPHTDWISVRSLQALCARFMTLTSTIENIDQEKPFARTPRVDLLKTRWPRLIGLDLYATATK
jgi:SAM-dependent methyltransferase